LNVEELFDVVDESDRVIASRPRSEVHREGLRHRAAHVLVFDHAGRLYVQRRALTKECSPGCWDTSAAGHVSSGEDYAAAAARELAEELGLRPEAPLQPLFKIAASPATGHEFVWVYRTTTDGTVCPDPGEIIDGRWCLPAEINAWLRHDPAAFTESFRLIWARLHPE
jgi:isopentenyl-diphosphate Delta-isomerase